MGFIIEFEVLAMKADTNKLHVIFVLKKNMQANIIKIILEYSLIKMLEIFKEWKVAITLVKQGYEFIEGQHNYKTRIGTIYGV